MNNRRQLFKHRKICHVVSNCEQKLLRDIFNDCGTKKKKKKKTRISNNQYMTCTCLTFASRSCHGPRLRNGKREIQTKRRPLTCTQGGWMLCRPCKIFTILCTS